jgi:hypothetical protein
MLLDREYHIRWRPQILGALHESRIERTGGFVSALILQSDGIQEAYQAFQKLRVQDTIGIMSHVEELFWEVTWPARYRPIAVMVMGSRMRVD